MSRQIDKKIYVDRLFPFVNELNLYNKLKINWESIMYISIPYNSAQITKIILNHLFAHKINPANSTITDATAGVGGNSISFAHVFKRVNAIELDETRYNYLANNIVVYGLNNVKLFNDNCNKIIPQLDNQQCIFMDPPWGGKDYKSTNQIRLKLGQRELEDVCIDYFNPELTQSTPRLIVLKLPKKYDIKYIYQKLNTSKQYNIYIYELVKMLIVVIEKKINGSTY